MASAIEVDGVSKRFRRVYERNSTLKATVFSGFRRTRHEEFWALRDVGFEVPEGSTFALVGENGSGKSTMLKCLAKIYRPDDGNISTVGKMSALLELGAGFHPELSGRENVYLNGSILGLSKRDIDRKFDDIVGFSGLEQFIDAPVKNYSSGMYVRLGFAVAINVEPDILLVDEVLAVGDADFAQRCLEKFAQLRREGRTIVVVSHGLDDIRSMCDSAVWLEKGEVQLAGTAGEVVDAYLGRVRDHRRAREAADVTDDGLEQPGDARVAIEHAALVRNDEEVTLVRFREPLEVCIDLRLPPERVVLELDVFRSDGIHVARTATTVEGSVNQPVRRVRYGIDRLEALPGVYVLSVRVLDDHHQSVLAEADAVVRFDVAADGHHDHGGIVSLGGQWST
jgi:ABC-2 type transport system ATP-binding protein